MALEDRFEVVLYGRLYDRYSLFAVRSKQWDASKPCCLVSGGVHGYETSGVKGALLFLETRALDYADTFNLLVLPCVSPWGYENVQRWTPNAVDPNRAWGALAAVSCDEANAASALVASLGVEKWKCHIDLHETTNTDATEFTPARCARDGTAFEEDEIPDGFYLVCDSERPQGGWAAAVIDAVRKETHIAPADANGEICGESVSQEGVILVPFKKVAVCACIADADFATTTEVYPDSVTSTAEECNRAQVAAVSGGLDYIRRSAL
ncbi:hypothetical protein EMIHUDRAFT_216273 [Emiliania huxleyi CCMP1516]|nr:hypothetical protein EMIHUDRAFT_216273 [Emiliania huxleyi CCMP1516]EOD10087.1 hypothetical protein EMIHUDRAFT_216273 [Emiliania huxleyi CCMP1516]|eukprot:XP_005762516.1 hypothetical protein EMIHUDRAFT_216273 [Emiliania huxleyi CCMP1516]